MASILVVDDEPLIRLLLTTSLSQLQHEVTQAENGLDAFHVIDHYRGFDLVITDIQMPALDGFGLLILLRHAYPVLPVLVLSAYPEYFSAMLHQGATTLLRKPFSRQQLLEAVENTLKAKPHSGGFIHPSP
jgi:CheY-like chemotaxis protein